MSIYRKIETPQDLRELSGMLLSNQIGMVLRHRPEGVDIMIYDKARSGWDKDDGTVFSGIVTEFATDAHFWSENELHATIVKKGE